MMNRMRHQKYLLLLLALALLLVVNPIFRDAFDTRLLFDVLLTAVFLAALLAIFTERRLRLLALLLGIPTVAAAWTDYVLPGVPRLPLVVGFHLLAVLFFGLTVTTILREVNKSESVSADNVYGAFSGYLLVGLAFGHIYCLTESLKPGSFRGSEEFAAQLADENRCHLLLTYVSFVTLTTVGYGEITPHSGSARTLAVVEAVLGQFYLAVLIAELIGKRVSQAISRQRSDQK
jgi:voltage-gated potassium channel